jgi:hypothetical protein
VKPNFHAAAWRPLSGAILKLAALNRFAYFPDSAAATSVADVKMMNSLADFVFYYLSLKGGRNQQRFDNDIRHWHLCQSHPAA